MNELLFFVTLGIGWLGGVFTKIYLDKKSMEQVK